MSTVNKTQTAPKFKVGDLVEVTARNYTHDLPIGYTDRITNVQMEDDGDYTYWVGNPDDDNNPCDLVSENEIELAAQKFQVGDLVRVTDRREGHRFAIGDIVKVERCFTEDDGSYSYKCRNSDTGHYWWVGSAECEPVIPRPQTHIATTSQLIQTIRRAHGWSQRELAALCEGLHQPNVSVLEKLDAPPTVELLSKLVKATGIGWGIAIQPSGDVQISPESDFYDSAISAILEDAKKATS